MGLRERKKEQTRRAIADAAFRLFAERGFQATTVADIAEAADIAPRTFFAYFPSKEDVLFANFNETFDAVEERLRARPAGESTFDALGAWIAGQVPEMEADSANAAVRRRLGCENPSIAARERHLLGRFEAIITESVAADLGDPPTDLRPRMIGAAAVAAITAMRPDDPGTADMTAEEKLARVNETLEFLRGGVAVLEPAQTTASRPRRTSAASRPGRRSRAPS
jgi:AcrR family transcriptional regulator